MSKDPIRSASKVLAPLLRRRGTSPAVGSGLRRAVQALDKALAASDTAAAEATRQALAELRACLVLIHESERPADHEQMEGTAEALSFLAPLEAELPAAPVEEAVPAAPSVFQTVVPTSLPAPAELDARPHREPRKPRALPGLPESDEAVQTQLAGLAAAFDRLHAVTTSVSHRLSDLDAANRTVASHLRTVAWLGSDRVPSIVKQSRESSAIEIRLAAAAALVGLHEPGGDERSLTVVERAAQAERPLVPAAQTVLRWLPGAHFVECASTVFAKTTCDAVRALLLPLLVERGQLSADKLVGLAEHTHAAVAIAAARALAAVGEFQQAPALVALARLAQEPARAGALLFAAVALGSLDALVEIRRRLRGREAVSQSMLDALAVAGNATDAALLVDLAAEDDVDAGPVLLAAASLGDSATLKALPSLADRVPGDLLDEARRRIVGEDAPEGAVAGKGRLFRGQPWSVAGLIERIADPQETVSGQRLLAIELRVRTGVVPPAVLPELSLTKERSETVSTWTQHYAKSNGRLASAEWYYQGRPLAPEARA